jgi:hypothetical protein
MAAAAKVPLVERLTGELQIQQQIRLRAYQIWQQRGSQPGSSLDDWLQAEEEIIAEFTTAEIRAQQG